MSTATLAAAPPEPHLYMTEFPSLGQTGVVAGVVNTTNPEKFHVAIYLHVQEANGWWTKPSFDAPTVPIQEDGTWQFEIGDAGADKQANKIAVFLLPKTVQPPLAEGIPHLPEILFEHCQAHDGTLRDGNPYERLLFFSGYEWRVKKHNHHAGPGPNYFNDSHQNVHVNAQGGLNMRITKVDDTYHCAEIISLRSFGYGSYTFTLGSDLNQLDPNIVLGLFTWSDRPEYHYREIDIEFSRWQDANNELGQYVVQPWDTQGNMLRFPLPEDHINSTHEFRWKEERIDFRSEMQQSSTSSPITWSYTGKDIPKPFDEQARINLWLIRGEAPINKQETAIILDRFTHTPLK